MTHPALNSNSVAVITGGGSGIGLAAATKFAGMGMRLVIVDRAEKKLAASESVLRASGAADVMTAAADVSDGLVADLGHIADASGVGAVVNWGRMPMSAAARAAAALVEDLPSAILTGGDDYELVFTVSPGAAKVLPVMARRLDIPLCEIGVVNEGGGVHIVGADGQAVQLEKAGYVHC